MNHIPVLAHIETDQGNLVTVACSCNNWSSPRPYETDVEAVAAWRRDHEPTHQQTSRPTT